MDPSIQSSTSTDIRATFGALLLGGLVAAILSGMIIAQGLNYLKSNTDPSNIRSMVGIIVILDILHTVTIFMGLWKWFIKLHEASAAIFVVPLSISISVILTALTTIIAHGFFAWRIFKLSKRNYWLIIPIVVPAVLAFVFSCISEAEMLRLDSFPDFRRYCPWALTATLALSSGVDAMITVMMMVLLRQSRAKSLRRVATCVALRSSKNIQVLIQSPHSMNDVIDSLFMLTLENGAITSLAAIICMTLWLTMNNFVFLGLYFIIDKRSITANTYPGHATMASHQGLDKAIRWNPTSSAFQEVIVNLLQSQGILALQVLAPSSTSPLRFVAA
ncbi:hypothetical protein F5877DRAFT_79176 [Lentinula edodes]|nr:hypothetical protein F5877DRAFT_79176 [Lentinula edodes]